MKKNSPVFLIFLCSIFILQPTFFQIQIIAQRYCDHEVLLPRVPLISIWEHQGSVDLQPAVEQAGFNTAWAHEGPWRERPFDQTMTWRHLNTAGIEHVIAMVSRQQWGWESHEQSMQHAARVAELSLRYPGKFAGIYMNDYYYETLESEGLPGRTPQQFAEITRLVRAINPRLPVWVPIYPYNELDKPFDFDFDAVICNIYWQPQVQFIEDHLNAVIKKFEGKKPVLASLYIARGTAPDGWMGEEEFRRAMELYVRYINEGKIIGLRIFRAAQLYEREEYLDWISEALVNLDPEMAMRNRDIRMGLPVRFGKEGETEITRWPDGKRGAVSLTWDDGSINQFRVAMPIMNNLEIPATFFINTARIPGSRYNDRFIGRDISSIIGETAAIPTTATNYLERSSAARYLGYRGTGTWFNDAAINYRDGQPGEAFALIDDLYQKVRDGGLQPVSSTVNSPGGSNTVTWDEIRTYADMGHEFASHTLSHPFLIAIDDANLIHEMVMSRDEIYEQLGPRHTFSMAIPYGARNDRVLRIANMIYPALRDTMSDPFFKEVDRGRPENAYCAESEYVKWMHEPLRRVPLEELKLWIDATVSRDNIWHIPVLHGVDGIGWEALPGELLQEYFSYIKSKDDVLWIATFGDVTRYIRARMNSKVSTLQESDRITVSLTHSLDPDLYDLPLTLKTYVSSAWKEVRVAQGHNTTILSPRNDTFGTYVLYQAVPNSEPAVLTRQ
jgi:peptidoglycan/xylan/chitin deacetylase (PgdA/CDA1 family)